MPDKEFLETYPLYRKFNVAIPSTLDEVPTPAINGKCGGDCDSLQTFNQTNTWFENLRYSNYPSGGQVVRAEYKCHYCGSFLWTFLLRIGDNCDSVTKVGQWPAWSITLDPGLARMLGDHVATYRKGLVCESQSYGIGAFAYYRRIVERLIDRLLNDIADLIPEPERENYTAALAETKKLSLHKRKSLWLKTFYHQFYGQMV